MPKSELTTREVIERFNKAFNRQDADGVATWLSQDTVFEDTSPAPDGRRIEGKSAVAAYWQEWFARNADAKFDAEDMVIAVHPEHHCPVAERAKSRRSSRM